MPKTTLTHHYGDSELAAVGVAVAVEAGIAFVWEHVALDLIA